MARMPGKRRRFWMRSLIVAGVMLILVALLAPFAIGHLFRAHLAAWLQKSMGAELVTDGVAYRAPYGLILYKPRIVVPGGDGRSIELFRADKVELILSRLPHKDQILLIRRLGISSPLVHLVHTQEGWLFSAMKAKLQQQSASSGGSVTPPRKPSELFQIDNLALSDAELAYDDRAGKNPGEFTLLRQLNLSVQPERGSAASYVVHTWSSGETDLSTVATVDIDNRFAELAQLKWDVPLKVAAQASSRGPAGAVMTNAHLGGVLQLRGKGRIDLKDHGQNSFEGAVTLKDASAHLPQIGLDLQAAAFNITMQARGRSVLGGKLPAAIQLQDAFARSAGLTLNLNGGEFVTAGDGRWKFERLLGKLSAVAPDATQTVNREDLIGRFMQSVRLRGETEFTAAASGPLRVPRSERDLSAYHWELLAYPRNISFQPRQFAGPFEHVGGGGSIAARDGVVMFHNFLGSYGQDRYLLNNAKLVLYDPDRQIELKDLKRQVRFQEIAGAIEFHQPGLPYPGGFGKLVAQTHPQGAFNCDGEFTFHRRQPGEWVKPKPDYSFHVSCDGGNLYLGDHRVPLGNIRGEAIVTRPKINISKFAADTLGGTIVATGWVVPGKSPDYDGTISLTNIDLEKLATQLKLPEPKHGKISGHGFANVHCSTARSQATTQGNDTPLAHLAADGEFEVFGGDFFSTPVLGNVVELVRTDDALTIGEAAGMFKIADQVITLADAAVSAPAIGLQGSGTIGFDHTLNLNAVAAPLGDWRDKFRQSHIPVLSDVAAEVAGAVQRVFNAAQGLLLYDIRITGTTKSPKVEKIAAPILTDSLALLFGRMLQPDSGQHKLLDAMKGREKK